MKNTLKHLTLSLGLVLSIGSSSAFAMFSQGGSGSAGMPGSPFELRAPTVISGNTEETQRELEKIIANLEATSTRISQMGTDLGSSSAQAATSTIPSATPPTPPTAPAPIVQEIHHHHTTTVQHSMPATELSVWQRLAGYLFHNPSYSKGFKLCCLGLVSSCVGCPHVATGLLECAGCYHCAMASASSCSSCCCCKGNQDEHEHTE